VNATRTKSKPWQRRRAQRRERILAAAKARVVEGGLDALTINGLARELEYSPGALYRYFASKEALIIALQVEAVEAFRALIASALEALADAPPLARVLAVVEAHRRLARTSPGDYRLVSATIADPRQLVQDAEVSAPSYAAFAGLIQQVAGVLVEASAHGDLSAGPALDRALVLLAGHQGLLQLHKVAHHAPELLDLDRLGDGLVDALLVGWGADPDSLSLTRAALRAAPPEDE